MLGHFLACTTHREQQLLDPTIFATTLISRGADVTVPSECQFRGGSSGPAW